MNEVHVHGVIARDATTPEGVRRIAHGKVAALVSDVDPNELTAARRPARPLEGARGGRHGDHRAARAFRHRHGGRKAVVDEFLAPGHDGLAAGLAELEGKVQLTVKGFYDEEALMRSVVESSPAIAARRERIRSLPDAAAYYDNIELGRLVAAEVEKARERETELVLGRLAPLALATSRPPRSTRRSTPPSWSSA